MESAAEIWTNARQGIICANRIASTLKEATLAVAKKVTRKTETLVTVRRDAMLINYVRSLISLLFESTLLVSRHKRVRPAWNLSKTGHLHQYARQFPVYLSQRVQA